MENKIGEQTPPEMPPYFNEIADHVYRETGLKITDRNNALILEGIYYGSSYKYSPNIAIEHPLNQLHLVLVKAYVLKVNALIEGDKDKYAFVSRWEQERFQFYRNILNA